MRGNRSAIDRWLEMAQQSNIGDRPGAGVTSTDPYERLGVALQAVVEQAVATALAAVPASGSTTPVMLSIPQAAKQLGVGTTKLKQLIASGQLKSVTLGRRRLVPSVALEAFATDWQADLARTS